jgi:hypothetical protein
MMSNTKQLTTNRKNLLARAVDRYKERAALKRGVRIGFLVDATASRENTWEQAQTIQAKMFRSASGLRALKLRLVYFGGNRLTKLNWNDNARNIAAHMAEVRCHSGLTQIIPGLQAFIDEKPENRADAIILIGDCFEEDAATAAKTAALLKAKGIKVFSFIEGEDWTAHSVFKTLATVTGGKFAKFGNELPLDDLCEGVALMTSGGEKALTRLKNDKVRLLLTGPSKT